MPSFKPKPIKKIRVSKKNSTTLDGKHKEFINEFRGDRNRYKNSYYRRRRLSSRCNRKIKTRLLNKRVLYVRCNL